MTSLPPLIYSFLQSKHYTWVLKILSIYGFIFWLLHTNAYDDLLSLVYNRFIWQKVRNTALISRLLVIITLQEPSAVNVWQLKLLANYKLIWNLFFSTSKITLTKKYLNRRYCVQFTKISSIFCGRSSTHISENNNIKGDDSKTTREEKNKIICYGGLLVMPQRPWSIQRNSTFLGVLYLIQRSPWKMWWITIRFCTINLRFWW